MAKQGLYLTWMLPLMFFQPFKNNLFRNEWVFVNWCLSAPRVACLLQRAAHLIISFKRLQM